MVSEKETARIRRFVCRQLDNEPDLSTLTLGILKKRYLAHEGCEALSPEAKHFMKQVVKEELIKMQENDQNGSELETKMPRNKRKREKENDEVISDRESEDESHAKKSRRQLSSSSESEDKEDRKTGSEESEEEEQVKTGSGDEEQEVKKSNGDSQRQINSEDSADEEKNESETSGSESSCADSPKEKKVKKKPNTTKNGAITSSNTSQGKKTPQSDEEDEDDSDNKSEKSDKNEKSSDDGEKEERVLVEKKMNESDSDSSSLPSLDEQDSGTENKKDTEKKKSVKTKESSKSQKEDNKAVVRLKRYISLCGVRHNYKKLLQNCRSVRSMVALLKKELEDLGVEGNPSIQKCKKVRMKREEAQEVAELDVSNIITTQGRPKRRGAWQKQEDPPSSAYQRSLNSGSDSDQENTNRGRRRATDWSNLQGIISDDADSD